MKNQNVDKSLWDVCELEKDFFVLRAKNELSKTLTKKHNTNIDHIQFHFCFHVLFARGKPQLSNL